MSARTANAPDMTKINNWIMSGNLGNWVKAAKASTTTYRQLYYVAKRLADVEAPVNDATVGECAKNLLSHRLADRQVAKLLLESQCPLVWLEILASRHADEEIVSQIHLQNESTIRRLLQTADHEQTPEWKLALRVRDALAEQTAIGANLLDELARTDGTEHWLKVASSSKTSQETLQYIIKRLQVEPDPYDELDELLQVLLCRDDLSEALRRATMEIQEYAGLVQTVQNQGLQEADLINIAKKLAATSIHQRQVCDAALSLSWHTNVTEKVIEELAHSTQSIAMFCVAQSELASALALNLVATRLHLMRDRNPKVYLATAREIIRHPHLTDKVVQTLINTNDDTLIYKYATLARCTEWCTLQQIADKILCAARNDYERYHDDLVSIIQNVILHPHSNRGLRDQIVARAKTECKSGYFDLRKYVLRPIDQGEYEWEGYNLSSHLPRMDWVVNMTAWQGLTTAPIDEAGGIMYPFLLKQALQSEYLTADYLDKVVQIFAFQTHEAFWDDNLHYEARRACILEALRMLYNSPFLTDYSREVLLKMERPIGDEIRKIAKSG